MPPPGHDSIICPRRIFGIYDDHDFGWSNSNKRLPDKNVFKNMYLDAIGEDKLSERRMATRGAWKLYTLNEGSTSAQIDIFVLDERYERDTVPCEMRREYCELVVLPEDALPEYHDLRAWCLDFLYGDSVSNNVGSCCKLDEEIYFGWCRNPMNIKHHLWQEACNVSSSNFAHRSLYFDEVGELVSGPSGFDNDGHDVFQRTAFCDVLGRQQRLWLRSAVASSKASLKIFVSGSVVLTWAYSFSFFKLKFLEI
jgi:alkaline phosphatase D